MKTSRYTKLGILITFSIAALIWGINYLKGIDLFQKNTTYYVEYERIDGLVKSSSVNLNGYEVGQVKNITFSEKNTGRLLVSFSIQADFKIPKGSVARIVSSDLLGTRSIKLILANSNEYYQNNDTIPGSIEDALADQVSMQVLPLKNKAEELLSSLDSAITVVTYIFNPETRKNLSESFEHINQTILNLEESSAQFNDIIQSEQDNIHSIIKNLESLSSILSANMDNIVSISDNLSNISDSLANTPLNEMLTNLSESINNINDIIQKVNSEKGTAGLLINDDKLYYNLTELSASLDYLVNDLRNNPERYVHFSAFDFGKNLYISPQTTNEVSDESDYIFKLNLLSSPTKIDLNSEIFKNFDDVEEMEISGSYNYLTGSSSNFYEILDLHESAVLSFPDASVVAFKNGRQVKIERALRNISK